MTNQSRHPHNVGVIEFAKDISFSLYAIVRYSPAIFEPGVPGLQRPLSVSLFDLHCHKTTRSTAGKSWSRECSITNDEEVLRVVFQGCIVYLHQVTRTLVFD